MNKRKVIIAFFIMSAFVLLIYVINEKLDGAYILPLIILCLIIISLMIGKYRKGLQSNDAIPYQRPEKSKFLIDGIPGNGHCCSMENGKEVIFVTLSKMDITNPQADLLVDDNTEPVLYGKHCIFCIQGKIYLYAILINAVLYSFDIRDLARRANILDPQDETISIIENKRKWLQKFFKQLEDSQFFFDIENNFK